MVVTDRLQEFRSSLYRCLTGRADELFELTEAVLCAEGPVETLVDLGLIPEHRPGHGALCNGPNCGQIDAARLRERLAALPVPRMFGTRIVLVVDFSPWLRPGAVTCPERMFCHFYGRGRGQSADQRIPGSPTRWWLPWRAARPVEQRFWMQCGWARRRRGRRHGRPAGGCCGPPAKRWALAERGTRRSWCSWTEGYDVARLAFVLADLPVHLVGRLHSDRIMFGPAQRAIPIPAVDGLADTGR